MLLSRPSQKRLKRLTDCAISLVFLAAFHVHFFLHKRPVKLLANSLQVLAGNKTWVGYAGKPIALPRLRRSVIGSNGLPEQQLTPELLAPIDQWYAAYYHPSEDLKLVLRHYHYLGN